MVGRTLGDFEVLSPLGRGGFASVWLARQRSTGRQAAIKVLQRAAEGADVKRFEREARILARLDHPRIVRLYEVGRAGGDVWLAMQYLEGPSLESVLLDARSTCKPLPARQILSVAVALLSALHYLARLRLYHRDLKPGNVLLDGEGRAYLTDFGLARFADLTRLTKEGHAVGTVLYMSPEQLAAGDVDHRSDLYQLGLVLYEMVFGTLPRLDPSAYQSAMLRATRGFEIPEVKVPGLSPAIRDVVGKAVATDPDQRWQSAAEMAQALACVATASVVDLLPAELREPPPELMAAAEDLRRTSTGVMSRIVPPRKPTAALATTVALAAGGLLAGALAAWLVLRPSGASTSSRAALLQALAAGDVPAATAALGTLTPGEAGGEVPVSVTGAARRLVAAGQRPEALRLLGAAESAGLLTPEGYGLLGTVAAELGLPAQAERALEAAVAAAPDALEARVALAELLAGAGDPARRTRARDLLQGGVGWDRAPAALRARRDKLLAP